MPLITPRINLLADKPALAVLIALLASIALNVAAMLHYPPWIDEAIIADIAKGYFDDQHQNFLLRNADEGRIYGPVFFYIQSFFLWMLGDSPLAFRLPNAIAGYLLIAVAVRLFYCHTRNVAFAAYLAIVLLISARLSSNAVSGRMDLVATFFAMSSLLCAWQYRSGSWRALLGSALLGSLAYLTTPRALFLLPASLAMLTFSLLDQRANQVAVRRIVAQAICAATVFLLPIWLWIATIGGMDEYSRLLLNPDMTEFLGPTIIRDWRDWIYLPILLVIILKNWRVVIEDRLAVACGLTFIVFSLCVTEVGPYKAMRLPFTFLLGALVISLIAERRRQLIVASMVAGLVATISVSGFLVRVTDVIHINRDCRDADDFNRRVLSGIPTNLSFLADYAFYYLLKGRPATFSPGEIEDDASFFRNAGYPDHILLNGDSIKSMTFDNPLLYSVLTSRYEVVANYSCAVHTPIFQERFENRRNFNNATLYRKRMTVGGAAAGNGQKAP